MFFVKLREQETKRDNNKDKEKKPEHISVLTLSHELNRMRRHTVPVLFRPFCYILINCIFL
ncbi:protein of unknown function [Acidithiobacillus ferrivorans]|uniref:Uncharacterized protein n=1 Tax=Acidithiobacillus ferrivorans TaxID=160808 RepID=A0A060UUC2_9PROT|nr:hypothetical protein AFERRI_400159 [Acidithiobacillus ferrivorans]SMH64405.1 protein of unknown function [Acidithiobacillus ferrivorans]